MTPREALRFLGVPRFALECGAVLLDVAQAYHLDGALAPDRRNVVLVFHALTGSADAAGVDTGWWRDVIGPGRAIDTSRWAVLCPNLLGSCYGTRWAGVEWNGVTPSAAPPITTRDQARFAARLVAALGIPLDAGALALVAGGSLGGMVALEWATEYPQSARAAVALAAPAAHPAWAIAWNHLQRAALDLAGPGRAAEGLALARQIAMLSYRAPAEFETRFGRVAAADAIGGREHGTVASGDYAVERYLERHGARLVARFDPDAYRTLLGAMDAHDVGRGRARGGAVALRAFAGRLVGVGVPGDVLYDADVVRAWTAEARAEYRELRSSVGHDAFLVEHAQVGAILGELLGQLLGEVQAATLGDAGRPNAHTESKEHAWAR